MKKALLLLPMVFAAACDVGSKATQDPKYQDKAVDQMKLSETGTPPPGIRSGTPAPYSK